MKVSDSHTLFWLIRRFNHLLRKVIRMVRFRSHVTLEMIEETRDVQPVEKKT